jgi:hypothetical protein
MRKARSKQVKAQTANLNTISRNQIGSRFTKVVENSKAAYVAG